MVRKIKLSEATANTNDLISSIKSNAESILRDIEDIKGCKFDSEAVRLLKAVKKDIIDARSGMSGVRTSCSAKYGSANEAYMDEGLLHTNDLSEDELEYSMEKYVGKPVEEARQFLNDLGFDMFVMAGPSRRNDTWEEYTSDKDNPGSLSVKLYFDLVPDSRDSRRKKNGKLTDFSVFRYE